VAITKNIAHEFAVGHADKLQFTFYGGISMRQRKVLYICIILILLLFALSPFVAVSTSGLTGVGGGCFSVVFDKPLVLGADRILVYEGDKVITITDEALVRRISSTFVVADRTDLCGYHSDRRLVIYNGEQPVRTIQWNACCELAEIYEADAAHWVFPSTGGIGQVEMTDEFVHWLDEIIRSNGK
jgi:hypothetical protein